MPVFSYRDSTPRIDPSAFVAPTATIVGDVVVEAGASIWYGAVVRGDLSSVRIGEGAAVLDGAVVHGPRNGDVVIGPNAGVGYNAVVHGGTLGENTIVGNGAVVLGGAVVGDRSLVAAGSLVLTGEQIPPEVLVAGSPAEVKGPIAGTTAEVWVRVHPGMYQELAQEHRVGVEAADRGP